MSPADGVSRHAFGCACGKTAATVSVLPAGHADGITGAEGGTVVVSGFLGEYREAVTTSRAEALRDALAAGAPAVVHAVEALWAPFWCEPCGRVWCREHWQVDVTFDEGFYDAARGTCPEGHERLIDD